MWLKKDFIFVEDYDQI